MALDVLISKDNILGNAPITGDGGGVVGGAACNTRCVGHEAERLWLWVKQDRDFRRDLKVGIPQNG